MRLLVIIPAYNEEASIVSTVEELKAKSPGTDFVVVNDGSGDRTAEICRGRGYPLLDLPTNLGLTGAFQTGIRYAWEQGYDAALQLDADGQHDPAAIARMKRMMEEQQLDLVLGSRFVTERRPRSLRMAGNALIETAIRMTTGKRVTDPTSGFRMVNRDVICLFARDYPRDYPEPESVVCLLRNKFKVEEVPVQMRERQGGTSSIHMWRSVYYMIKVSIAIIIEWIRG